MESSPRAEVVRAISENGVVAVIRMQETDCLRSVIEALAAGGLRTLEITMTVPGAVELIRALSRDLPGGVLLGAGTVLDAATADEVIRAGARFVVAPTFNPEVVRACHRHDVAAVPGCFSPTEIVAAWNAGADLVKVFPATALGPGFFKDLRGPLPHIRLMPTGGVTLANAGEWIRAGAAAIGVGTALVEPAAVRAGDFAQLAENARRFVAAVRDARE